MTMFGHLTMDGVIWALAFAGLLCVWTYALWHFRFHYMWTALYVVLFCVCALAFSMGTLGIVRSTTPLEKIDITAVERREVTLDEYRKNRAANEVRARPDFEYNLRQSKTTATILVFGWIVGGGLGLLLVYLSYRRGRVSSGLQHPRLSDISGFVDMLAAACEDAGMQGTLEKLLSLPDVQRKELLAQIIQEMRERRAPKDIVDAFICLQDDAIAEKAYEAVYKCPRGVPIAPLQPLRTAA
jgi:hypothetical protein